MPSLPSLETLFLFLFFFFCLNQKDSIYLTIYLSSNHIAYIILLLKPLLWYCFAYETSKHNPTH